MIRQWVAFGSLVAFDRAAPMAGDHEEAHQLHSPSKNVSLLNLLLCRLAVAQEVAVRGQHAQTAVHLAF